MIRFLSDGGSAYPERAVVESYPTLKLQARTLALSTPEATMACFRHQQSL